LLPQEQPEVPLITYSTKSLLISLSAPPPLRHITQKTPATPVKKGEITNQANTALIIIFSKSPSSRPYFLKTFF
jgi:hypothetical protein